MLKPLILASLVASAMVGQSRQVPSNFTVRLEFGCNGVDVLDTAKGTYEREMSRGPRQVAKIVISDEVKQRWSRLINEARFYELSSKRLDRVALCEPSVHTTLRVSSNGRRHTVRWDSCYDEGLPEEFRVKNAEYRRIETLVSEILKDVNAMPSVALLLPKDMFCL